MAVVESIKKAHYIGKWQEDTFSDEVFRNIAAYAKAEKGKRVKLVFNRDGLRIIKHKILKDDEVEFYPLKNIKTVTKNPRSETCVMFILTGNLKKYQIITFRCDSVPDAVYITNVCYQLRQNNNSFTDVELRKRSDTGNWTLRERSAHNASLHLKEVFKEQQRQVSIEDVKVTDNSKDIKINGGVPIITISKAPNGILKQTSKDYKINPYTNIATEPTKTSTVTTTEWKAGQITAYSNGGVYENGAVDKDDSMKALVDHAQMEQKLLAGTDAVMVSDSNNNVQSVHEQRIYATPGSRRVSGDGVLIRQYRPARVTGGRNSMVVRMDSPSVTGSHRSASMRVMPIKQRGMFTVQRSIEETYGKPAVVQGMKNDQAQPIIVQGRVRRGSGNSVILSRNRRPASIHVMGGNALNVHQGMNDMKL